MEGPQTPLIRAGKRSNQAIPVAEGRKEEVRLAQGLCSEQIFPLLPSVLLSWSSWTPRGLGRASCSLGLELELWGCDGSVEAVAGGVVNSAGDSRPGADASGPEPLALLLTPGRGEGQEGPLVTLCSRAISEPRIGSRRIHLGLGLCSFIFCCVDLEQVT